MKRFLKYIAIGSLLFTASCSDDMFDSVQRELPEDGTLEFRYSVPEMQGIRTRGVDEDEVKTLTLLVFDGSRKLKQVEILDPSKTSQDVVINQGLRKDRNMSFLLLANAPASYNDSYFEGKIETLKEDIATLPYTFSTIAQGENEDDIMCMSGQASLSDILEYGSVALYRTSAKITANWAKKDETTKEIIKDSEGLVELGEALPYLVIGTADACNLFAGADQDNLILNNPPVRTLIPSEIGDEDPSTMFYHPTKNQAGGVYIIVKASYNNKPYYYRLDFESDSYINVEPNHWYQFVIDEVKGKGYDTPDEASKNPTPKSGGSLDWNIIDHSPRVYNIVTDGKNSLGVAHSVTHSGAPSPEEFYVRVSNKDGQYDTPDLTPDNFICDKSWMRVSAVENVAENGNGSTDGKLYKVQLNFYTTNEVGSQTGNITVRWRNLSRVIPVYWNREFDASEVVAKAELHVLENGSSEKGDWYQADYFDFLESKVFGVAAEENNGEARNEGFHFPVMYGNNPNSPWTYKYNITFKNQTDNSYKWRFSILGDDLIKNNVKINIISSNSDGVVTTNRSDLNGPQIELTMDDKSDEYAVGTLLVEVAPSGTNDWREIPLDIYHTGFFHKDDYKYAVEGSYDNSRAYTYYGVVKIGNNRWLDRNIGAHSAELYIEQTNGNAQFGSVAGRGAYFYVAKQNGTGHDLYANICPPGYQVPYITDWDAIRKSSKFVTTNLGAYTTAYYASDSKRSDGSEVNVYFSKARYYDASTKAGDSTVGYYWSQTTATGFEKDERGRWMKSFVIFGEATQTSNARIDYSGEKSGFAMSLRCVSTHDEAKDTEQANFFVTGATHIFAYSINSAGERVPVATWPGTPIANYNTANGDYINYRYLGATKAEDLYIIFNFKGENGQIHSISKDGITAKITTTVSPNELLGWKAAGDDAPNNSGNTNHKTGVNSDTEKYYWNINITKEAKITLTTEPKEIINMEPSYRIHGTIFGSDWDTAGAIKALSRESGSTVWRGKFTVVAGEFVIQKVQRLDEDDDESFEIDAFKRQGGTGAIQVNTPTPTVTSTSVSDGNFTIPAGTYTFSFDSATQMLTVIDSSVPANTYRVYWKKDLGKTQLKINSGEGISEGNYQHTGEAGDYYYFDTTAKKFNFCLVDSNGGGDYTQNNGAWWVMKDGVWGNAGSGYAFWIDKWDSSGSGLPQALK